MEHPKLHKRYYEANGSLLILSRNSNYFEQSSNFQKTFHHIKERKSSSSSGRHIGHYKSAATNDDLSTLYAELLVLPLQHGFSNDRWKLVTDVVLLKKANGICLHRLGIIQLIEADFNQFLRIAFTSSLAHRGDKLEWSH
jgi:hypothetical protein